MNVDSCYRIGRIIKPHGIKGNVSVFIDREAPEDFGMLKMVYAEKKHRLIPLLIKDIVLKGDRAYMHFDDVDTLEEAESYRQCELFLPKDSRPEPAEGRFYKDEVIDFAVIDQEAGKLGTVKEVRAIGPTDMLIIDSDGKEILIPVNGPFIQKIQRSKKSISVSLPDGFLEI